MNRLLTKRMLTALFVLVVVANLQRALAQQRAGGAIEGLSTDDWSSIRAANDAARHAVRATEDGYEACNPGQRWRTRFDGRGFLTEPDAGSWTWGLKLERYGFADAEAPTVTAADVRAEGGRVVYVWGPVLDEWYVNGTRGLEHGYTVHSRPSDGGTSDATGCGPLTLTLAVRGSLLPAIEADGHEIHFSDGSGELVLTYTGLAVIDAGGNDLPASFECSGNRVRLLVDDHAAQYPITIDPIAQQAYLKASNTGSEDRFGRSVAVSGDTVLVGAPREDSSATGVNGDQGGGRQDSGAAYVFVRSGGGWTQEAYLKASNTGSFDYFGTAVAIDGDTAVVGAPGEDSAACQGPPE